MRGPGEVLGTRQAGQVSFRVADLAKDTELLDNIAAVAEALLEAAPDKIPLLIARWLGKNTIIPRYKD